MTDLAYVSAQLARIQGELELGRADLAEMNAHLAAASARIADGNERAVTTAYLRIAGTWQERLDRIQDHLDDIRQRLPERTTP